MSVCILSQLNKVGSTFQLRTDSVCYRLIFLNFKLNEENVLPVRELRFLPTLFVTTCAWIWEVCGSYAIVAWIQAPAAVCTVRNYFIRQCALTKSSCTALLNNVTVSEINV
jgi:hypothetical protein